MVRRLTISVEPGFHRTAEARSASSRLAYGAECGKMSRSVKTGEGGGVWEGFE